MDDNDRLLTFTDAGKVAGVSRTTVTRWVDSGWLAYFVADDEGFSNRRIRLGTLRDFLRGREKLAEKNAHSAHGARDH